MDATDGPSIEVYALEPTQRDEIQRLVKAEVERRLRDGEKAEDWDKTPKGDLYWLTFRKEVLRLLEREIAVSFSDVKADPWFQKESHVYEPVQWDRARTRLIRNRPRAADDTSEFAEFYVEGKGGKKWYLAVTNEIHCAAEAAVAKEHVAMNRRGQIVRRLREKWKATEGTCTRCKKDLERASQ